MIEEILFFVFGLSVGDRVGYFLNLGKYGSII